MFLQFFLLFLVSVQSVRICSEKDENLCLDMTDEEYEQWQKPYYQDHFGIKMNWMDPNDGWCQHKRLDWMKHRRMFNQQLLEMPRYTKLGFKKMKIPKKLFDLIVEECDDNFKYETCEGGVDKVINCQQIDSEGQVKDKEINFKADFFDESVVKRRIKKSLKPILEKWSGVELRNKMKLYGIRRYKKGALLWEHLDRKDTHIISAILQIDQKVNEDWNLRIVDHSGQKHAIALKPGEMVLYESASVMHGRQVPLNGTFYDNLFVHYRPKEEDQNDSNQNCNSVLPNFSVRLGSSKNE